jgi:predicted transcriptional regulator
MIPIALPEESSRDILKKWAQFTNFKTMRISDRKMDMAQRLFEIDDEQVLDEVQAILDAAAGNDWYDSLKVAEKAEVAEADADIAAGRVSPHNQVMERLRKWTRK